MSTPDAAGVAHLAQRLGLISEDQVQEAWMELGTKTGPADPFLRFLERKGYITPWQASKLVKGDTDGYVLGGYKLLYKISAGTFGRVYRAENQSSGEVVAIKVLRKRWAEDQRKIGLFEREGKVGLGMQHPNIVRVLAVNKDAKSGQYFIVMEFVEGGNLKEFLQVRKKLTPLEALKLLEECASGLNYALGLGMTHRDLKATNILISSTKTAKLVDFGLAEIKGGSAEDAESMDRTVEYAGLERATDVPKGDYRSDIYFLGTTFHEMVTGRPLLNPVKDARARMQKQRFELGSKLNRDDPDLPPPVFSILSRLVALDPTERFQSYEQIIEAIATVRAELQGGKIAQATGTKTVFVIEHNTKLQDIFREKLKEYGYRVLISINPAQAVSRYTQQPFHAIIVDCGTANRDGLDAYKKVLDEADRRRIDCAGILILNEDQAPWATEVEKSPKSTVMVRPVLMKQILQTLRNYLGEAG
ncbi:MAG TPA: serine/threonine-protein kinase [Gemmataceae bacterium]|nr:serine/threonine-protein kinase [Gemmataceae bacterium]